MKAKLTIAGLFLLFLTSCIKDYYGGGGGNEEIELTSENYLYEGSIEKYSLENRIMEIDDHLNQKDELHPDEVDALLLEKEQTSERISILEGLEKVLFGIVPPIPCDMPNNKCVPKNLRYILTDLGTEEISVQVFNANQELVAETNELSPMPDLDGYKYTEISVPEESGVLYFSIVKIDSKGMETVYFQKLGE
ncbi:hypothetical protein DZC72_09330 [Maribacter algicola]|uniref:Uncharacterized protein n=1 Tax=Maribacter algicola TaxID=2498892 RepID=A0A3R8S2Y7_9FLAO|nr:hypothetical protein [Maribacter algicola]RRQ50710.1 hypothetical protein DZC72_09330 [Maribacter algicola]